MNLQKVIKVFMGIWMILCVGLACFLFYKNNTYLAIATLICLGIAIIAGIYLLRSPLIKR